MNCIIVDDELLARKGIELLAKDISFLNVRGLFPNPVKASNFLSENNNIDLIFLDIEMPGMTGLEFINTINSYNAMIILTTAYPQHALEAYDKNVLDYLVKPIKFDRFLKAVNKAKELYDLKSQKIDLAVEEEKVYIRSNRKYIPLKFSDILYVQGMKDYVTVYTDSDKYMCAMNLKTINKSLPISSFARINKSTIINIHKIDSIENDSIWVNGLEFSLGNTYKDYFINTYIKTSLISR